MQIYLARNNVQAGPYSLEQLNQMLASSEVLHSDLMWHSGMVQWKTVGEMTSNQNYYQPDTPFAPETPKTSHQDTDKNQRVSVAELYGKSDDTINEEKQPVHVNLAINKPQDNKSKPIIIASSSVRILAYAIDYVVALAIFLPVIMRLDIQQLNDKYTSDASFIELMQFMSDSIPNHIMLMTNIFFFIALVIQSVLLIKRGQTIGKVATGIKIVDYTTKSLPSLTNIFLLRTIIPQILYRLPMIGFILMFIDLLVMLYDKEHRSLHDKFANTYVIKTNDSVHK